MRPPGGYSPDMMNWANDIDVYNIYSDMVVYDHSNYYTNRPYHCVYCGRRDGKNYYYNNDAITAMYENHIMMNERMPDILSGAMGNYTYTARFETLEEVNEFIEKVLQEA